MFRALTAPTDIVFDVHHDKPDDAMLLMRVVHRPDGGTSAATVHAVHAEGLSIGRSRECDLFLDDPLRLVSRRHAWVMPRAAGDAVIRCVSSSASLTVNGQLVLPGEERVVGDCDRIGIGAFELVLEAATPPAVSPSAPIDPRSLPIPNVSRTDARHRLDRWFDLDDVADALDADSPLAKIELLPAQSRAAAAAASVMATATPHHVRTQPTAVPVQPHREASDTDTSDPIDSAALRRAFLKGAGLDESSTLAADPVWARHAGALLRCMTDGTFELVRGRAVTRQNIGTEGTSILARENNPLKFARTPTECLHLLLLENGRPGFLNPLDALHETYGDLRLHQLALLAGVRAAIGSVVRQVGPAAVEQAEGPASGAARVFPWLREASLWRRQRQQYARLIEGFDEALDAAFKGGDFLQAYEAQARRGDTPPVAGHSRP